MKTVLYLVAGLSLWITAAVLIYTVQSDDTSAVSTVGVHATPEYQKATEAAMDVINGFVGCPFLVAGSEISVQSATGEPCGDTWRPESEQGHAATAYKCGALFEIHLSTPGDAITQVCVIAHELGHVLGLEHASSGIMDICRGEPIRVLDADRKTLRAIYCE